MHCLSLVASGPFAFANRHAFGGRPPLLLPFPLRPLFMSGLTLPRIEFMTCAVVGAGIIAGSTTTTTTTSSRNRRKHQRHYYTTSAARAAGSRAETSAPRGKMGPRSNMCNCCTVLARGPISFNAINFRRAEEGEGVQLFFFAFPPGAFLGRPWVGGQDGVTSSCVGASRLPRSEQECIEGIPHRVTFRGILPSLFSSSNSVAANHACPAALEAGRLLLLLLSSFLPESVTRCMESASSSLSIYSPIVISTTAAVALGCWRKNMMGLARQPAHVPYRTTT